MIFVEELADSCNSLHLSKCVMIVKIAHNLVNSFVSFPTDMASCFVYKHLKVIRGVKLLQEEQVLLKIMNCVWQIVWLFCYFSLIRGKTCSVNSVLIQVLPVLCHVALVLEISKKSLTDRDVIRCRIVVELLMPLLIEMA